MCAVNQMYNTDHVPVWIVPSNWLINLFGYVKQLYDCLNIVLRSRRRGTVKVRKSNERAKQRNCVSNAYDSGWKNRTCAKNAWNSKQVTNWKTLGRREPGRFRGSWQENNSGKNLEDEMWRDWSECRAVIGRNCNGIMIGWTYNNGNVNYPSCHPTKSKLNDIRGRSHKYVTCKRKTKILEKGVYFSTKSPFS